MRDYRRDDSYIIDSKWKFSFAKLVYWHYSACPKTPKKYIRDFFATKTKKLLSPKSQNVPPLTPKKLVPQAELINKCPRIFCRILVHVISAPHAKKEQIISRDSRVMEFQMCNSLYFCKLIYDINWFPAFKFWDIWDTLVCRRDSYWHKAQPVFF